MRILLVEDEARIAQSIKKGLEGEGYHVTVAPSGEEGFFLLSAESFDLVILDLMLPGRDGIEILKTMRARGAPTPVLVLTARGGIEERVRGLNTGADDYMVKPFAFPELLARIRALLRRGRTPLPMQLRIGNLEMDIGARQVTRGGEEIELTRREFELLEYLMRNQGQLVSREMLAREVWNETARATPLDNVIDVHIARLRRKVDQDGTVRLIHTVRGVGFILKEKGVEEKNEKP
ncbi:MAG: response regulator transcription factor [Syntrophobacteraceae bacterium]